MQCLYTVDGMIISQPSNDAYRKNWESVFKDKRPHKPVRETLRSIADGNVKIPIGIRPKK